MLEQLKKCLEEKHLTIASAESYTGGLFAASLTSLSGASKIFIGSFVTYSNESKVTMLGVKQKTLNEFGAISKKTASEMAIGVKDKLNPNIAISFTGNAGPTGDEGKPVGLVYIGIMINNDLKVFDITIEGSREEVRINSILFVERYLLQILGI